jgi:hypothetical protein
MGGMIDTAISAGAVVLVDRRQRGFLQSSC